MKPIIVAILIINIFCGLVYPNKLQYRTENKEDIVGCVFSENFSYSADFYDFSKLATTKEISQNTIQWLISISQKLIFSIFYLEKNIEGLYNNIVSDYLYFSNYQIIRFEGPDIIYPFNYFL